MVPNRPSNSRSGPRWSPPPAHYRARVMDTIGAVLAAEATEAAATHDRRPLLFGIAGGVGVGKTTAAADLGADLATRGLRSVRLSTDCFLHPNAVLSERGRLPQKGFPDTFDSALASDTISRMAAAEAVEVPVYSHDAYDIVADRREHVAGDADVVVVEGIYALQPAIAEHLHVAVFLDAPEPLLRSWFVERFLELCRQAEADEASFYRLFVRLDEQARRDQAVAVWEGVNAVNLREHILPTSANAHVVVEKGDGHTVVGVRRHLPPA